MRLKTGYKLMKPKGFAQGKKTYALAAPKTFADREHAKEWAKRWLSVNTWVVTHTKNMMSYKPGEYHLMRR